ncbi:MAG: Ribosomal silencing factor RsfS [Acidimicrobiales bacterium]|nr:MAG: ribosome silencing factor [Actinomycetota bacterium]MBV6507586.1 Ribosomal silencing factor RsfS [Acidimicrobiales bacterium]RIK07522.1 MAG: ribosome silencing factor [Acidobacteriota bacterium]
MTPVAPAERFGHTSIEDLAVSAARAADDKKALDVLVLEVGAVLAITDYFVIASGKNPRQVKAIVDEVERVLSERYGAKPRSVEGRDARRWVLMDYGDFLVHVFQVDERQYYSLERLYSDVPVIGWRQGDSLGVSGS